MTEDATRRRRAATEDASTLALDEDIVGRLRLRVPDVATQTVHAITVEVPAYRNALAGPMGATITSAVELALGGFLRLAGAPGTGTAGAPMTPALDGAYELGRGEARSGRTMDALLAAYRVGARESWREFSRVAVDTGLASGDVARFAELVFAYIDELSAASGGSGRPTPSVSSPGSPSASCAGTRPTSCSNGPSARTGSHRAHSPRSCCPPSTRPGR